MAKMPTCYSATLVVGFSWYCQYLEIQVLGKAPHTRDFCGHMWCNLLASAVWWQRSVNQRPHRTTHLMAMSLPNDTNGLLAPVSPLMTLVLIVSTWDLVLVSYLIHAYLLAQGEYFLRRSKVGYLVPSQPRIYAGRKSSGICQPVRCVLFYIRSSSCKWEKDDHRCTYSASRVHQANAICSWEFFTKI